MITDKVSTTLDHELMALVKEGFVSMPGGADPAAGPGPVAGGGMLTQAQAAPMGGGGMPPGMDPAMMAGAPGGMPPGMDPAAMGAAPPMDPAAMAGGGGMPLDPSMQGMPPMPPMDPAAMGGDPAAGGMEAAPGNVTMSFAEFKEYTQMLLGAGAGKAKAEAAPAAAGPVNSGLEQKLDQLITVMSGLTGA